jgi:hypothetical protein
VFFFDEETEYIAKLKTRNLKIVFFYLFRFYCYFNENKYLHAILKCGKTTIFCLDSPSSPSLRVERDDNVPSSDGLSG